MSKGTKLYAEQASISTICFLTHQDTRFVPVDKRAVYINCKLADKLTYYFIPPYSPLLIPNLKQISLSGSQDKKFYHFLCRTDIFESCNNTIFLLQFFANF